MQLLPARCVMWLRCLVLPGVAGALVVVVAAVASRAATFQGGGPLPNGNAQAADCYIYAEYSGTQAPDRSKYLVCTDGDPACDLDGACNGSCRFQARVCTRLAGVQGCEAPESLASLRVNSRCPLQPPATLTGSVCGAFVEFDVPLQGRNQQRRGRTRCTASGTAPAGVRPRTDVDVYVFACAPCAPSPSGAFLETP
jgi:hypothetical protein